MSISLWRCPLIQSGRLDVLCILLSEFTEWKSNSSVNDSSFIFVTFLRPRWRKASQRCQWCWWMHPVPPRLRKVGWLLREHQHLKARRKETTPSRKTQSTSLSLRYKHVQFVWFLYSCSPSGNIPVVEGVFRPSTLVTNVNTILKIQAKVLHSKCYLCKVWRKQALVTVY